MKQLEVIYPFDIEVLAETKRILRLLIHNELVAIEQRNRAEFCAKHCDQLEQRLYHLLGIINEPKEIEGEPNASFISQERICIGCERSGEIYCYYAHHLTEIEAYLSRYQIPYYVRKAKDYWIVKYDKEADL